MEQVKVGTSVDTVTWQVTVLVVVPLVAVNVIVALPASAGAVQVVVLPVDADNEPPPLDTAQANVVVPPRVPEEVAERLCVVETCTALGHPDMAAEKVGSTGSGGGVTGTFPVRANTREALAVCPCLVTVQFKVREVMPDSGEGVARNGRLPVDTLVFVSVNLPCVANHR